MSRPLRLAVVGATGLVGRELLAVLDERQFPISDISLFSSPRGAGDVIECGGRGHRVAPFDGANFEDTDIVFLAVPDAVAAAAEARRRGTDAVVIDLSQIFSDALDVPLIVPEVNAADVSGFRERNLIASADATLVPLAVVANPIREQAGLRRVVATSLEPVSAAGNAGVDALQSQTRSLLQGQSPDDSSVFAQRVAFNVVPQVGELLAGGSTLAERRVADGLRRVLDFADLPVSVTRVFVPMFFGQGIAVHLETEELLSVDAARSILRAAPGVILQEELEESCLATPADAIGQEAVCVGRVRADEYGSSIDLWLAIDNLRKGAATNAVQIAEILLREYL